jgi:hypothetical protein
VLLMGAEECGRATRLGTPILVDASGRLELSFWSGSSEVSASTTTDTSGDDSADAAAAAAAAAAALSFWRGPEPLGRPGLRRVSEFSVETEVSWVPVDAAGALAVADVDGADFLAGSLNWKSRCMATAVPAPLMRS